MKLSPKQIAELPTLEEVILNFVDLTDDFEDDGVWRAVLSRTYGAVVWLYA